jgi:arylsulfatase A-like enzyme
MIDRPNLLFIIADQLRADFLGCYGASFVKTPNIDTLAAQGVRYDNAYTSSPICVPARASLLTGLNSMRNGVLDNTLWLRPDLAACGIRTWPEMLNSVGYYTAGIGKMHFYPWDTNHGLQYRVIAEDKRWIHIRDDYYHFLRARGERKYHGNEHEGYLDNKGAIRNRLPWELSVDHFVGEEAVRFPQTYGGDGPFAAMVSFPGPHCPYDPNEEFLEQVDPQQMPPAIPAVPGDADQLRHNNVEGNLKPWNGVDYSTFTDAQKQKVRAHYAASTQQIDVEIGRIMATLAEQGLLDNTIVIFTSDHGDYLGDHGFIGKGLYYESAIHIPLIVRVPGGKVGVYDGLVELTDVTATLLAFAGATPPQPMDSRPLPDLGLAAQPRSLLFGFVSNGWMAYDGRWKLCKYATGEQHLFDRANDPDEQINRIKDPAAFAELRRLDDALTREVMRSVALSFHAQKVDTTGMSQEETFGKEGWQRPYPYAFG